MRKLQLCFVLVFFAIQLSAQHKVKILVTEKTSIKHDSLFISGTFNNWDSTANTAYRLKPIGSNKFSITLNLIPGAHRFKITRGSWFSVEKKFNGDEISDHEFFIKKDTVINLVVEAWRDQLITDKWLALSKGQPDTTRIGVYTTLAYIYAFFPEWYNNDSAMYYAGQALSTLQLLKTSSAVNPSSSRYVFLVIENQEVTASLLHSLGNYLTSLELRLDNVKLSESTKDTPTILWAYGKLAVSYVSMKDYDKVLHYFKKIDSILDTTAIRNEGYYFFRTLTDLGLAEAYYNLAKLDSCIKYASLNYEVGPGLMRNNNLARANKILGDVYSKTGANQAAYVYYKSSMSFANPRSMPHILALSQKGLATILQKQGKTDSALYYARHALFNLQNNSIEVRSWGENIDSYILEITPLIASLYKQQNQPDSAYKYLELSVQLRDNLYNLEKLRQFQTISFNETVREQKQLQQAEEARPKYESRIKIYALIGGLLIAIAIAFLLYRNNKHKQKANLSLEGQKRKLEKTLDELKLAQAQLIQSEKMASLGELTAGIAHEIQNPLNFVNNFSEVNTELIDELQNALNAGNTKEAIALANDVKENEQKINHHGKRADAIVKGMLQHSRTGSGIKEPTDINALADEYLRLSYHGLRAKDKSFNVKLETHFDEKAGNINVIQQDIGRVFLNLFSNAFYAATEKKKLVNGSFEPLIVLSTKRIGSKVIITLKDNGIGIPEKLKGKIFQPFFTTKPTGQGTGLGLSLSYDLVKAHGGEIEVKSKEAEGTEITINLPV